jgi:adenine-specific DNA-methyltransferase
MPTLHGTRRTLAKIKKVRAVIKNERSRKLSFERPFIWNGRVEAFLDRLPNKPMFDLVVTSPPYNIGKSYERKTKSLSRYFSEQRHIIQAIVSRLKPNGSLCWQVGNFAHRGEIMPLDLEFHKIFRKLGLKLRNRIVWRFGHGLHSKRRLSGRYEVVLWYTKSNDYTFNLDAIRIPSKYPAKRFYKGARKGDFSSNPLGKNPEDVWDIPNVKSNHVEKTVHPCQFPVGLIERLVLALTDKGDVVFDPFAGVGSAGVAALHHGRRFVGCEPVVKYTKVALGRLNEAIEGKSNYRPHDRELYDHTKSKLSIRPIGVQK